MLIEGKVTVKAPIQKVWDGLLNPDILGACVPGVEKIEAVDEKTYDSIVGAKVGPINARFKFRTTLTELDPPKHLKASGSGEELSKAGNFSQETVVDLKEIPEGGTEVSYRSDVKIVGRLATFGDRIMRAKAKELGEQVTQCLDAKLSIEDVAVANRPAGDDVIVSNTPSAKDVPAPQLKVSTPDIIAAFFATIWARITSLFRRSKDKRIE